MLEAKAYLAPGALGFYSIEFVVPNDQVAGEWNIQVMAGGIESPRGPVLLTQL